jgi:hypothetical protein
VDKEMVVDGRVQQEIPAAEGVQTLLREVGAVVEVKAEATNKNILKYTFIFFYPNRANNPIAATLLIYGVIQQCSYTFNHCSCYTHQCWQYGRCYRRSYHITHFYLIVALI